LGDRLVPKLVERVFPIATAEAFRVSSNRPRELSQLPTTRTLFRFPPLKVRQAKKLKLKLKWKWKLEMKVKLEFLLGVHQRGWLRRWLPNKTSLDNIPLRVANPPKLPRWLEVQL